MAALGAAVIARPLTAYAQQQPIPVIAVLRIAKRCPLTMPIAACSSDDLITERRARPSRSCLRRQDTGQYANSANFR
jgi:hypothetical protein